MQDITYDDFAKLDLRIAKIVSTEKIHAEFTKGIINGTKTLSLQQEVNSTHLVVVWNIKLSGMMGMFTGMVKKHIQSGTEQALQSIKQEAEK